MKASHKRFAVIALILALSLLLGFAVNFAWDKIELATHPDDHLQYVRKYAYEYNISEAVIFAIIKVESDFDTQAESAVGARGLMQMLPSTFEWLTGDDHLGEHLHKDELFDPEVSIRYGTYYLNYLYEKFDRNMDTALAAYNGGEGNVAKWLADEQYSDGNGNLTDIPFEETKNYVQKVNKEMKTYRNLYYKNSNEVNEE